MMQPQVSALLDSVPSVSCLLAGLAAAVVVVFKLSKCPNLDAIPTIGSDSWLGAWWDGHRFQTDALDMIQEGYEKYKTAPFKVRDRYRWLVVLGNREHMDEIRKAPNDAFSFAEQVNESVKAKYTLGEEATSNSYQVEVIRSHLTRNLGVLYNEIRDEICTSFDEVLDLKDHEWKSVSALTTIQQVVCRVSNRLFVGLPLCRDPDWISLNLKYTMDVMNGAVKIRRFPDFLAPLVAYFMTDVPGSIKRGMSHLVPIINERVKLLEEYGKDWPDQPNDILSWMLDLAPEGHERSAKSLTIRILGINFAAIHTSSNSFTHALFYLAANPQYMQPLREEVESIVEKEGWSKASIGKMRKVDSFLRECQRLVGIGSVSLARKAMKDYTFSDGTFIPKGASVVAPSQSLHLDNENYENALEFNPFRFSNMREEGGEGTKHQFVSTSLEYLTFGHGRHACPGRFFAANELKSMLAHIVVTYDVKLKDNEPQPEVLRIGVSVVPNPFARVMFRNRIY